MWFEKLKIFWERAQNALAGARAQPLLAFLGLVSGIILGIIVVLFRLIIETSQAGFLPGGDPENYEALGIDERFLLAVSGGIILGLLFFLVSRAPIRVGVVHVMERLIYHEGHLPLKNAVMQFIGGSISLITGQSAGREGPCIHLGAAAASLLGQRLSLPNNSIRTLVACGIAAAIAASFNMPLAGVIFAMEVVFMEYTISGFTPVILAAVSATVVNRLVFGTTSIFVVPNVELATFWELPIIAIMGIGIGAVAAIFIVMLRYITQWGQKIHFALRMTLAGIGVGCCAVFAPEVMSIGYDTVNDALLGEMLITSLIVIIFFKILATTITIGLSIPAGLIGPTLFIGSMIGCLAGLMIQVVNLPVSPPGLYAMLGMAAMMGATLQAPLAALLALLELTGNVNIIFPGMLAVISANLAAKELFKQESVYLSQIKGIGLDYKNDPVSQLLRRLAITSVMNQSFVIVNPEVERDEAEELLVQTNPQWLIVNKEECKLLMPAADLAHFLENTEDGKVINLLEIPSNRRQMAPVRKQATLQQVLMTMDEVSAEAVYILGFMGLASDPIYGIATKQDVTEAYRKKGSGSYY